MPYYSDELIEEVRAANDIVDVISGYVDLKKKGADYFGLCPFHNEKTPSFSVSRNKQIYYCFGCHEGGNVLSFLMKYDNLSFQEAMQVLADRAGIALPKQEMNAAQRQAADRRSKLLEINKEAALYFHRLLLAPEGKRALEYLKGRGLTDETIKHFGLGYSNKYSDDLYKYLKQKGYADELLKDSGLITIDEKKGGYDKFWNRAMFPIMDAGSRVIGFGGRVMGEGEPKYLNSPETAIFEKSRNLYGLNFARRSRRPGFLLCEGYMDVIALHQAGFDNAVAALGTSFTSGHANLLRRYAKEVYLTFDSDEAGIRAALRAIPLLREVGLSARVVDMQPHKDPDEFIGTLGAEEYQKRIDTAEPGFLFEVRILVQSYDLNDPERKTTCIREIARRLIRQFPDRMERENYMEAIARQYPIGMEQLREAVNSEGAHMGIVGTGRTQRAPTRNAKPKESEMRQVQSLLLTWMVEDPTIFDAVARYIGPEDFTGELDRAVAQEVFAQYEKGKVEPARIVGSFPEEEQQREAAGMFAEHLPSMEDREHREKALNEAVRRVKKNSLKEQADHMDQLDAAEQQRLINERSQLEKIQIKIEK